MEFRNRITTRRRFSIWVLVLLSGMAQASYLRVDGNRLLDDAGRQVRLTGTNWFGLETSNLSPHGLWSRDYRAMLNTVAEMGFNCIRIPYTDRILEPGAMPVSITFNGSEPSLGIVNGEINGPLRGKTSLEVLDALIAHCAFIGLKVILDNHSREPDGYANELVWYTTAVPESKWIENWVTLARRYRNNATVIAFDLDNEPHGSTAAGGSQWGTGDMARDWRLAAERCGNAILQENPDVLILVEGVEQAGGASYWWGGNLIAAGTHPVRLSRPDKLVYSPHEYGPEVFQQTWFSATDFPSNLPAVWDRYFGYLHNQDVSHLLIGEFGIRDTASFSGRAGIWFDRFMQYMGGQYSWTFWCLNPNSGDTGGLLDNDWRTPVAWKLDKLRPYLAPRIGVPVFSGGRIEKGIPWLMGSRFRSPPFPVGKRRLRLVHMDGRSVLEKEIHPDQETDLSAAPAGLYILELSGPGMRQTWQVVLP